MHVETVVCNFSISNAQRMLSKMNLTELRTLQQQLRDVQDELSKAEPWKKHIVQKKVNQTYRAIEALYDEPKE